ncbi:MAG: DEAD/DEAH box helicase [Flavobacteriales bacterium]|nr:DEAD/DEAH box helicase [Flavobacteriales bacterium]
MKLQHKSQANILQKLGIKKLNPMQEEAQLNIVADHDVMLLSPTGTGKTLAFLLPIIGQLDEDCEEIQVLILVPSRELAIQINQVIRDMGSGYKTNAVYGGKSGSKDRMELKHRPAILVGTPGRVADHMRRHTFTTEFIKTLVLDEFDKSLEVGFEKEMKDIISSLFNLNKRVLTSATQGVEIPSFVRLRDLKTINFLKDGITKLKLKSIHSPSKDKLETLAKALSHLGNKPGIIFCNYKDSIQRLSVFLTEKNIPHGCFYGGMEQIERERALLKFRNGTHQIIIATDLAARGIDVPEIAYIIHYQLPHRREEFIHRNGRTARMNTNGTAYILHWKDEQLPEFIGEPEVEELSDAPLPKPSKWKTLYISGGRKDKISKGDIAGLFFKKGNIKKEELGTIELKDDCSFVAVHARIAIPLIQKLNNTHLKKRKIRVNVI